MVFLSDSFEDGSCAFAKGIVVVDAVLVIELVMVIKSGKSREALASAGAFYTGVFLSGMCNKNNTFVVVDAMVVVIELVIVIKSGKSREVLALSLWAGKQSWESGLPLHSAHCQKLLATYWRLHYTIPIST